MTWYPREPALDWWREVYCQVARAGGGEPDGGRYLVAWAHAAGLDEVAATGSVWCYATAQERAWWGDLWAERVTESRLAERAVALGIATPADLADLADGWRRWAAHPDGWFSIPCAEILHRVPADGQPA
jgi:hypothetical protein